MPPGAVMAGSYNYVPVAVSVLISMAGAYAALDLAGRITDTHGWVRLAGLMGGAAAIALFFVSRTAMGWLQIATDSVFMGGGIAALHYTAMMSSAKPCRRHRQYYHDPWK